MSAERVNQENETKQVSEAKIEDKTIKIKEVKYELNSVENLKKAKDNVKRSETTTRIIIDDKTIKFELNSDVYLEVKRNSLKLKKDDEICIGVKMKVTLVRKTITKIKKDSPQASIYYEDKEDSTKQTAKVVQHMYHTKQVVHLQGGGRLKKTAYTSYSLPVSLQEFRSSLQPVNILQDYRSRLWLLLSIKPLPRLRDRKRGL